MINLLSLALLVTTITSANLTVYPEHNPQDESDFLHIHFTPENLKKYQAKLAAYKIIYKLGRKLDHDETFVIKLCPLGTLTKLLSSPNDKKPLNNCVSDNYGSLLGINHHVEVPLYQFRIQTYYKTCFFGGATAEAERSLISVSADDIKNRGEITGKNLFNTNVDDFIKKYEDTKGFNYRLENSKPDKEDFRCTLQFNIKDNFDLRKFSNNVKIIRQRNTASILIIEYDMTDRDKTNAAADTARFPKNTDEEINKRRDAVISKLSSSTRFVSKNYINSTFNYKIISDKGDAKGLALSIAIENAGGKLNIVDFPVRMLDNQYVRFVPFVCKSTMSDVETASYMFLNSKDCGVVGDRKVLIIVLDGKLQFFYRQEELEAGEEISLPAVTMDFEFYAKNDSGTVFIIKDFEERADAVYDEEKRIVYLISYQKVITKVNDVLKPHNPDNSSKTIPIKLNGRDKVEKRLLYELDGWQNFGLVVLTIFSCVLMGAVYFWGSAILAMLSFVIILLCVLLIAIRQKYRLLPDDFKMESPSIASYMTKNGIENHQSRIKALSSITPNCFNQKFPWVKKANKPPSKIRKVLALVANYNKAIKIAEDAAIKAFKKGQNNDTDETGFNKKAVENIKRLGRKNQIEEKSRNI